MVTAPPSATTRAGTPAAAWRRGRRDLPALALPDRSRVVVVGAHPDDETLGAGGLLARRRPAGMRVEVVTATAGRGLATRDSPTHSRRGSWPSVRRGELRRGHARLLAPGAEVTMPRPARR